MGGKQIEEKINSVIQFQKENATVLQEWKRLVNEARTAIFQTSCKKPDLGECDPWHCSFKLTNDCDYPEELAKLEKITRII